MKVKKFFVILLSSLVICTTVATVAAPPLTTQAHPGKTDSCGGHKDKKNVSGLGSYHYHCGGYPAHLHTDGVCPYAGTAASISSSTLNANRMSTANTANNNAVSESNTQTAAAANNAATSTVVISDTSYDNVAFNASYYANKNKDVYDIYGDDAKALYNHFITSGIAEGRQSSAQFNVSVYKSNNQDLSDAFGDDLIKYYEHFIECGYSENRVSK